MGAGHLIDTHTWLWWLADDPRLSEASREILGSEEGELRLSTASAWEIAIKVVRGKLRLGGEVREVVVSEPAAQGVAVVPIALEHVCEVAQLPLIHRDPFDRMLIAQARCEGLTILTRDPEIRRYDVDAAW